MAILTPNHISCPLYFPFFCALPTTPLVSSIFCAAEYYSSRGREKDPQRRHFGLFLPHPHYCIVLHDLGWSLPGMFPFQMFAQVAFHRLKWPFLKVAWSHLPNNLLSQYFPLLTSECLSVHEIILFVYSLSPSRVSSPWEPGLGFVYCCSISARTCPHLFNT